MTAGQDLRSCCCGRSVGLQHVSAGALHVFCGWVWCRWWRHILSTAQGHHSRNTVPQRTGGPLLHWVAMTHYSLVVVAIDIDLTLLCWASSKSALASLSPASLVAFQHLSPEVMHRCPSSLLPYYKFTLRPSAADDTQHDMRIHVHVHVHVCLWTYRPVMLGMPWSHE